MVAGSSSEFSDMFMNEIKCKNIYKVVNVNAMFMSTSI